MITHVSKHITVEQVEPSLSSERPILNVLASQIYFKREECDYFATGEGHLYNVVLKVQCKL